METVNGLNIAYIGGGSRLWAFSIMRDLALEPQLSGTVRLYDINYEAACQNESVGNRINADPNAVGKWNYKAVKSLEKALTGADFVIASILPGTFDEMQSDVHAPEKLGVYQAVGDTVGPGGALRALRTIPMYEEIALAIQKYAPDAWVINYTNPMSVCTRTLYEVFPGIKAIGCCHEVFGTQEDIAAMLGKYKGIEGVARQEIKVNVLGINHFTWFDKASYKGMDLMPFYKEVIETCGETGFNRLEKSPDQPVTGVFQGYNLVKFDLFKRYGLIAAAGDRHLAEFMPRWYLKDPETVKKYRFELTPVSWRVDNQKGVEANRAKIVSGEQEPGIWASGEEGVIMMKALLGLADFVTNVNLPNTVQMDGVPKGAVVETNALLSKNSARPLYAGGLPDDIQSIVLRHIYNQECLVKAGLNRDRRLAFNAFVHDPLMSGTDLFEAEALFDEMIANTKKYLPGW